MKTIPQGSWVVFIALTVQMVSAAMFAARSIEAGQIDVAIPLLLVAVFCGANIAVIEVLA